MIFECYHILELCSYSYQDFQFHLTIYCIFTSLIKALLLPLFWLCSYYTFTTPQLCIFTKL